MRIISGLYKGKKLLFINNKTTRPLRDMVKESIFNIIEHSKFVKINIKNAKVLDLYSGTGSFGIECISRGADRVTFVEKDSIALKVLNKNLNSLQLKRDYYEIKNDVYTILNKNIDQNDIFFFDPPFSSEEYIQIISEIKKNKKFRKNNLFIIHRENKNTDSLEEFISIHLTKKYGRSKIVFGSIV